MLSPHPTNPRWLAPVLGSLLLVVLLLALGPSLKGAVLWDDEGHMTGPHLAGWAGLARIWFEPGATQQYYPVTHTFFWLQHAVAGDSAPFHRGVNLLLHCGAAFALIRLLMLLRHPWAWGAGFLFALHPMAVESVAWISEQKNTLSLLLALLSAILYIRFLDTRKTGLYAGASLVFLAALLAKSVTCVLPACLFLLSSMRRGRLDLRTDAIPLIPWLGAGVAAGLFTAWFERTHIGASGAAFSYGFADRLLVAGRVPWFYLWKWTCPWDLSFIYPRWNIQPTELWQWIFPLATLALTCVCLFVQRTRALRFGWLLYVGILFPALGFLNVYPFLFSYVADHFHYHASIVAATGTAFAFHWAGRNLAPSLRIAVVLILAGVLVGMTHRRAEVFANNEVLYQDTLQKNPGCWLALNNLAQLRSDNGKYAEAEALLHRALALRPQYPEALNNLGHALRQQGRPLESVVWFEKALALQPGYGQAHHNLALAWADQGERKRAIEHLAAARELLPGDATVIDNLGLVLAQDGRIAEALPLFEEAARLSPENPSPELNWGIALHLTGRLAEAVPHFERAISLAPSDARARRTYARALFGAGRASASIPHFEAALLSTPNDPELHRELAHAYRQLGQRAKAAEHYEFYLRNRPAGQ